MPKILKYSCGLCSRKFKSSQSLNAHAKVHKKKPADAMAVETKTVGWGGPGFDAQGAGTNQVKEKAKSHGIMKTFKRVFDLLNPWKMNEPRVPRK